MSSGSWRSKTLFNVYFESFVCGPDEFILSVKISFSISGKKIFFMRLLFYFLLLSIIFYPL